MLYSIGKDSSVLTRMISMASDSRDESQGPESGRSCRAGAGGLVLVDIGAQF